MFFRRVVTLLALITMLVALTGARGVAAHSDMATPEASPEAMSMSTGAVFMTIENGGTEANRLVSVATDAATTAEIHEMAMNGDVMEMKPLADGLAIPAGDTVSLEPGGYHVMLFDLAADLTPGMTFDLTLTFETGGKVTITSTVGDMGVDVAPETVAQPVTAGDLTISGVWSRPAPAAGGMEMASPVASPMAMTGTGAVFMTIANDGDEADRLVSVSSDVAMSVEVHEMAMNGDVMEMKPLEGGLEVPAGGTVALEPGGYHVMMVGLMESLTPGMTFEVTLTFEHAGEVTVTSTVGEMGVEEAGDNVAAPVTAGDITISGVWSRPAPKTS